MEYFFNILFGDAICDANRLAIFTLPGRDSRHFTSSVAAAQFASEEALTKTVYFGVGLAGLRFGHRNAVADISAIPGVWADIDCIAPHRADKALPKNVDEVRTLLARLPFPPTLLVDSGHGIHAYWLFKESWLLENETDRTRATSITKGWHGLICDEAKLLGWTLENLGDLSRLLRAPGTINRKCEQPVEVRIIEEHLERRFNPSDFEPFAASLESSDPIVTDVLTLRADAQPPAEKFATLLSSLPAFVQAWNKERPELNDQSQSAYDLSLANIAALNGWTDQEIADLLIAARRKHDEKPEKALRSDYMQRTISEARRMANERTCDGVDLTALLPSAPVEVPQGPPDPGAFPAELIEQTPDIVRSAFDYYLRYAFETQPVLFLGSMIAATGAVLGHKVKDASGLRTNIYTLGITPSGGGKEATREAVRRIFFAAGIGDMCGPEDFASDSGLIAAIEMQNPILFQLDEFGRLMHSINISGGKTPYLYNIASVLLKMYGKAGSVFRSKAYADPERNKTIVCPHVCLYGTTVASNFWRSMSPDYLEGGYLPRLLLFESQTPAARGNAVDCEPPDDVVEFFRCWARNQSGSGNLQSAFPTPVCVAWDDAARGLLDGMYERQKIESTKHDALGVLWSRARENAGKLALIHACWRNAHRPVMELPDAKWAIDVVDYSVRHAMRQAFLCMSESTFHERCQQIMRVLEKAAGKEISRSELTRFTRSMTPRDRDEAIKSLIEQGWLTTRVEMTAGRSATYYRRAG